MAKLKLPWGDYKSTNYTWSVWFTAGFTIYAIPDEDKNYNLTGKGWRVRWYTPLKNGFYKRAVFPGLTDKLFKTRYLAQLAAERFMEMVMDIAPRIVQVTTEKSIPVR